MPWNILGIVIAIYLLINLALPEVVTGFIATYVIQPALWLGLGLMVWRLPKRRPIARFRLKKSLITLAILVAIFQIAICVIAGLFSGFGKSPYSFTLTGILINLIFVGSALIGIEFSRAYMINKLARRNTVLILGLVALLYTVVCLPLSKFTSPGDLKEITSFSGSTLLPLLAENLLASFLALLGGPIACIAYRGTLQAFAWFSPVLPDLGWAMKAIVGIMGPTVGFLMVQSVYSAHEEPRKASLRVKRGSSVVGWGVVGLVSLTMIWFSFGLFPVHATTIVSGSMRPTLEVGDIALVQKVDVDIIEPGDIIQFKKERVSVLHRVVDIQQVGNSKLFVVKGDANREPDSDPVYPEQIVGKSIYTIPKVGWGPLILRGLIEKTGYRRA